jgi:hypothetical protein
MAIFWLAQRGQGDIDFRIELGQVPLDLGVAGRDQFLALPIRFQRLTQRE